MIVRYLRYDFCYSFLLVLLLVLYSCYSFLNARNIDKYADLAFVVMLLVAAPRCAQYKQIHLSNTLLFVLLSFVSLSLASVIFPPSLYADSGWLTRSFYRLFVSIGVLLTVARVSRLDQLFIRWGGGVFALVLYATALLVSYGIVDKGVFGMISPMEVVRFPWNDKYYAFWFVYMMWCIVALNWRQGRGATLFSLVVLIFGFWSVFLTSSESAQLALVVSLFIFLFCHIPFKKYRYVVHLFFFLLFFFPPLLWLLFVQVSPIFPDFFLFDFFSNFHGGIGSRVPYYNACSQLIADNIFLGYGFGSSLSVPVDPNNFSGSSIFPGGHPHNIIFLFFLELGLFGFLWLLGVLCLLFNYVYTKTWNRREGPAIWAMLISAQVIFSLSFDMWQADVVMIYTMLFVLLRVCVGNESRAMIGGTAFTCNIQRFLIVSTSFGILCYILNSLFFL
ncbi:O-antigen ligase family protein [Desulfogranum marinum]|uniref:O-antigen ligase family protein n=1 Tax=Desulfogranum marinum TaxID=453220 RepID=UPI0019628C41|nr:O-antigen ligase family protein [Desulfogranum marinum]MBM9513017.1 O-antigen ligase family protein [Desulfogranum marinum]